MTLCVFLLLLFLPTHAYARAVVTDFRIGDKKGGTTRLILDMLDKGDYTSFALESPPRIVVDIEKSAWSVPTYEASSIKSRLIKNVRHGIPQPGKLRVVVDLKKSSHVKKTYIIPPDSHYKYYRLVVDITAGKGGGTSSAGSSISTMSAPKEKPRSMVRHTASATPSGKPGIQPDMTPDMKPVAAPMPVPAPAQTSVPTPTLAPAPVPPGMPASMQSGYHASPFTVLDGKRPEAKPVRWEEAIPTPVTQPKRLVEKIVKRFMPTPESKSFLLPLIVIDAGHGGIDPGAIGKSGTKEKDITLAYARSLRDALLETGRYRVVMTRNRDVYVDLNDRVKKARQAKGELFISVHADSSPKSSTRGVSVYTLSEARAKREARKLENKVGKEEVIKGVRLANKDTDVQQALIGMAQRDTKNTAASFAEVLVDELGQEAKLLRNSHRHAGFVVLTGADVPSVLIELGYLSNRDEERQLRTSWYRNKLVGGIRDAVDHYFRKRR